MEGIIPPFWEALIKRYLKETFYPGTRKEGFSGRGEFTEGDYRFFAKGVGELSRAFTQERALLPRNYLNRKELRSGYLFYFLPVNALKVASLLPKLPVREDERGLSLTVLDVGCGPGTGMLGTMRVLSTLLKGKTVNVGRFPSGENGEIATQQMGGCRGESGISPRQRIQLRWILIDQNRQVLGDARALHEALVARLRTDHPGWEIESILRAESLEVPSSPFRRFVGAIDADLILALNLLGEIPAPRRFSLVEGLLHSLRSSGRLLLMEPALQGTTRDLMALHDEIVSREAGYVEAPCLHQAACPMRADNRRDWCHTYISWERPAWIEKIDRLVGIRKDYLKCSYLVLRKDRPPSPPPETWRVVSGPLNSKGKSERLLCGEASLPHLLRVMRLDRDHSAANGDFDRLERGDVVSMPQTTRLGRETRVRRIRT